MSIWPSAIDPVIEAALDGPKAGFFVFDSELRVQYANKALSRMFGMCESQSQGAREVAEMLESVSDVDRASVARIEAECRKACASGSAGSFALCNADGSRAMAADIRCLDGQCWICTVEDLAARTESELLLVTNSARDPLTSLATRAYFEHSLAAALAAGTSGAAVLLIDLDRFKAVNDTLGHATGDGVLRLAGQRIQSLIRRTDVAARLGGDEFAVLLVPAPEQDFLENLAARAVDLLGRTYMVNGHVVNVGASVGIAISPNDGNMADRLLQSADLAMYASKGSGRGTFHFFDRSMEERAQNRRALELELRKALPLRQLEVHYRPQIDITSRQLIGFESELRWRHPDRGLMHPDDFRPLAEELGLTLQIDDWVLRTACREAARWPAPTLIGVRTARAQFESGRFVQAVERALKESSLDPQRLEIEITEAVLLNDQADVLATLHELRSLGVRIGMDEFGTGYASLTQLASFPFDRIRIDRSLMDDGSDNPRRRAIVRAIASLGASLGISTTAQGVETSADLERIHTDGCASMQGHFPAQAVAAHETGTLFEQLRPLAPAGITQTAEVIQ